jgi:hypothetical protein
MTMHDQSDRTKARLLRPTVLLLIVAIHGALLVVASRQMTRVATRSEEPLIFLALPDQLQVPTPAGSAAARPRKKLVAPRDSQFITVPTPAQPSAADNPPAPIDWNSEAGLAIKRQAEWAMATPPRALDKHGAGADLNGGLDPDQDGKSDFGWDRSHTHRVESLDGGGMLIHINERCIVVLIPFPLPFCGIGKIPVRGDLLDHMHDEPPASAHSKNTAP